jgi:hypothetical protein
MGQEIAAAAKNPGANNNSPEAIRDEKSKLLSLLGGRKPEEVRRRNLSHG